MVRGDHRVNEIKLALALGALPARPARGDRGAARAARVHRPRRRADGDPARRGGRGRRIRDRRQPARRHCGVSSPVATSPSRRRRAHRVAGDTSTAPRSGSSRRSRWATSSSSARATASRWAPSTWTSLAPSSTSGWAVTALGRRGRRSGGRAVRRRAWDLLAAHDRALRRRAGRARQAGQRGARSPTASTPGWGRSGWNALRRAGCRPR